jgi:4-amino-4-deoxy-L-arabinose transferase-like glycosyltransferase
MPVLHRSPDGARTRAGERVALGAIVAGGLALRLWGIDYGLPHPTTRPDEEVMLARLFGFDTGDPNPRWFMYPTFYLYLLYGWVKLALVAGAALGAVPRALAEAARDHPVELYLVARAHSVVCGTLAIAAVFWLGRMLGGVRAGLVGALLLSVAFLHVRDSHFFKPEAAQGLFIVLLLLACVRLQRQGTLGAAALAGAACGLAFGVKYSLAPLVPLGVAAVLAGAAGAWRRLAVAGAAGLLAVVLTSPYMVLEYRNFLGWMAYTRFLVEYGGPGLGSGFGFHARRSFLLAHGLPFSLFALGALLWSLRVVPLLPVALFLIASALQLGVSSLAYTRYVTPLLPALCVLMGVSFVALVGRVPADRRRLLLGGLLLVVLLAHPLHASVRYDQITARPDTRLLARRWLEANVPAGTTVLALGAPWPFTFGDPVLDGYRVRRNPNLDPALGIAWVLTHEHPAITYSHPPDGFAALTPQLRLVATFNPFTGIEAPPSAVFETQDAFYVPIAGFDGVVRGGPLIRIYAVARPAA